MGSHVEDALPNWKVSLLLHQNTGSETAFCGGHVFGLHLVAVPMNSPFPLPRQYTFYPPPRHSTRRQLNKQHQ